ncbi:MAG TPA: tetratricopeptide repeat protein [Pirellulales bacterium]
MTVSKISVASKLRRTTAFAIAVLGAILFLESTAWAENEGLDDLDQASDKKVKAESLEDLNPVIDLCESALNKGLDATNTAFANNLLASTLMERAEVRARLQATASPAMRVLALGDLQKALKINPKLPQAFLLQAQLQALGGDLKEALKSAEAATDAAKDQPEFLVQSYLWRAKLVDNTDKRIEFCNEALKVAPANQDALELRGKLLLATGKPQEGLTDLEAASKADPKNVSLKQLRATALLLLKRNDDAVQIFTDLIKQSPEAASSYLMRAKIYSLSQKPKEALEDVNHALQLEPGNLGAKILRAQVLQRSGDLKAARAAIDEIMKQHPDIADQLLDYHAQLAAGDGDFKQAIEDFETLRKLLPKNFEVLEKLGQLYSLDKKPRKAIDAYTDALVIKPDLMAALEGRANMYLNIGKHAEAVSDYNSAMKIDEKNPGVLNNLAWVLATSPDDKVRDGKRSIELGTKAAEATKYEKPHILSTLAAGYAESGDWDNAKKWSQKANEVGKDDPEVDAETREQLKKELASYEEKKPWREKMEMADQEDGPDPDKAASKITDKPEDKGSQPSGDKSGDKAGDKDKSGDKDKAGGK